MLFNSWSFIGIFLPITLAGYSVLLHFGWTRAAFAFLTLASICFYGAWNMLFLPLLLGSLIFNYAMGTVLIRCERAAMRRVYLVAGIAFNLSLLFYFKYAMFFQSVLDNLAGVNLGLTDIILPIGISFITFQKIAYLVDVYRRSPVQKDFLNFALFVTFFPQLIAGPIVHHFEVMPQFSRPRRDALSYDLAIGITIFAFGLAKKVILADSLSLVAQPVFNTAAVLTPDVLSAWVGLLAYTLQIYFDFSGYSDMAVGLAMMFGIRLPSNFSAPYRATSIIEFWGRWHITLSRFLRDYLYIPLGGSRAGEARRYGNIAVTMLLGGIWHGAGWTFVLWGAMHGSLIVINHAWRSFWRGPPLYPSVGWALTFFAVMLAWVPFRSTDLPAAWRLYAGLLGVGGLPAGLDLAGVQNFMIQIGVFAAGLGPTGIINPIAVTFVLPAALLIALAFANLQSFMGGAYPGLSTPGYPDQCVPAVHKAFAIPGWRLTPAWALIVAIVAGTSLLKLNDVSEFIYFQF